MGRRLNITEGFNPNKVRKNAMISAGIVSALSFAFIVVVFSLGLYIFPLTATLPDTYQIGENTKQVNWESLDGFAGLATVALVAGGVFFGFINYLQNAVQRKREESEVSFNFYKEIYDRLMNPSALSSRRWVIENLPTMKDAGNNKKAWLQLANSKINKVPRGWKGERSPGKEHIKNILNTFDFIGFVAEYYWNMENELVMWMSPSIAKVWERIEVYVEEEAEQRNEPDYYESARRFGKSCVEWRRNKYPESVIIKDAT